MEIYKSYINGEFTNGDDYLEIINPTDLSVAGKVSALNKEELNGAFESAKAAFEGWSDLSLEKRKAYIIKFRDLMLERKEELAKVMFNEIAKSHKDAIAEIERTASYINDTLEAWETVKFSTMRVGNKTANLNRVPLGVVLAISPFNYPVNLSLSKIIPGLLVGNTIVFKPATNGSLTGGFLARLFDEIKIPKGVFNLTTGRGRDIGDELTANKNISMISFTGSVRVGKQISKAQPMIPLVLELGGNDAGYVKDDADMELALSEVAKGAFSYSGQRCTAIKRLILNKNIAERFLEELNVRVSEMKMAPLVSVNAGNYVSELIEDSVKRGDKFVTKGTVKANHIPGHVVVTDMNSRAWKEEAFGPLLPVIIVEDEKELLNTFNQTDFGLQNSLFTRDVKWAKKFAEKIQSGTVNINRSSSRGPDVFPFSGIKDSGFGTQGVVPALESMSRILNIVEND